MLKMCSVGCGGGRIAVVQAFAMGRPRHATMKVYMYIM